MLLKSIIENADDETWIRLEGSLDICFSFDILIVS